MKTILITGSTRGIGKGLATEFLKRGQQVVVTGRTPEAVNRVVRELETLGQVLGVACDVRSYESQQAAWAAGVARFGRIDMWINNAAISTDRLMLSDVPPDTIRATVETNLLGALYGARVALEGMLRQGGGQIFLFEGFGSNGMVNPGLAVYGSTKRAIRYLTASLAREYRDSPVLIGSLSPGIVTTDLLLYSSKGRDPADWARAKRVLNILADRVETVTPWLAEQALANRRQGARIEWLTPRKSLLRFVGALFRKRDLLTELESRPDLTVR